jgi:hypothetical protein
VVPELDLGIRYKGILESGHGGVGIHFLVKE